MTKQRRVFSLNSNARLPTSYLSRITVSSKLVARSELANRPCAAALSASADVYGVACVIYELRDAFAVTSSWLQRLMHWRNG